MKKNNERFDRIWIKLSEQGWCDSIGGMEYTRVYSEWIDIGSPREIEAFIKKRANIVYDESDSMTDRP